MTPSSAALLVAIWLAAAGKTRGGEPVFDPTTLMRLVLVPADAPVGSVVYRVRASDPDFDYPLQFELLGESGRLDISIVTLPCTRYNSVCQANVVLRRRLEAGRYVDFRMSVRTARGRTARMACSIAATNATTPRDTIFPHAPSLIIVPEDAKRGTELDFVIARKSPLSPKGVELELWGSPLFAIRQRQVSPDTTEGTLFLLGPLDFETQSMYHLTLLALNPYAESESDSRNIAGVEVVVAVSDVQDVAPVWREAPPVSVLRTGLQVGDAVLRVHAEDGDKGAPRQLRYGLVSEGNPFTPFFSINETTGEITLERPLEEMSAISHVGAPVLLTVVAEEVRLAGDEPEAMSSTAQLAFILPDRENTPPYFENQFYVAYLDENSPLGTALVFSDPYIPEVSDNDAGKNGVFSLTLAGNNGTFEVSPTVAEHHTNFFIKVRDNNNLDYEARKSVIFQIIAQELGPATNLSATANVTVYLNDVNDNPPVFLQNSYEVELAENVTAGTRVMQVAAEDVDTGIFGRIQYTAILGYLNTSLHLDPMSGIITIATNNHGFDREEMNFINFLVEARDNDGVGLRTTVPLIIKLLDVNDEPPQFERSLYEFVLSPNLSNFTSPAYIKANDKDAEPPNNIVQYEIIHGNFEEKFALNEKTGELYLLEALKRANTKTPNRDKRQFDIESEGESEVYVLTVRAYDLGVPRLHSTALVKVYPPESKTRTMLFIVPGNNPDRRKTEEILSSISGGKVTILEVRPYRGNEVGATDVTGGNTSEGKSVVLATVLQSGNSVIDVSHIQQQLGARNQTYTHSALPPAPPPHSPAKTSDTAAETIYKAENKLLFWLLIFLAICVALVLLALVFCCVCEGCPLYMPPRKRVIRVNSTDDDVHLVVREKAGGGNGKGADDWRRREAWSAAHPPRRTTAMATATATKPTQWRFDRRHRAPPAENTSADLGPPAAAAARDAEGDGRHSIRLKDGPNIIYTKEMQLQDAFANKHRQYMTEMENDYDRIATLHYARKQQKQQQQQQQRQMAHDDDNDSLQRHEAERGSQLYIKSDAGLHDDAHRPRSPHSRDTFFIKEGNTEILRLLTRGNEEERYVNVPVPQHRPAPYIPPPQYIVVDNGKDLLMQRFIREQGEEANYLRERLRAGDAELANRLGVPSTFEGELKKVNLVASMPNLNDINNSLQEIPGTIPVQSEKDLKAAARETHTHSHYQQELLESSIRRQNELLHQILLERNRLHNLQNPETASQFETKLETQSLPGQSVMATQTDCHISTQTEPHLLKPNRRKVRSDNDSYSEEDTETMKTPEQESRPVDWAKRKKPKKKIKYKDINPRKSFRVFDVERKIRTPILEENEISLSLESEKRVKVSTTNESEEHVKNYGETQTSMLKTSENQVISSTEIKKKLNPKHKINDSLQREVLLEISDSLDEQTNNNGKDKRSRLKKNPIVEVYKSSEDSDGYFETNDSPKKLKNNRLEEDDSKIRKGSRSSIEEEQPAVVFSGRGSDDKEQSQDTDDKLNTVSPELLVSKTPRYIKNGTTSNETVKKISLSESKETHSSMESKSSKTKTSSESEGKAIEKTTQKSVPRYMQWYNKKNAAVATKQTEKVIPAKPKRTAVSRGLKDLLQSGNTENDKVGNYGKIVTKEKVDNEPKKNTKSKSEAKEKEWIHPLILKEGKVEPVPPGPAPDVHPLLQHSQHRYEHHYHHDPAMHTQPTHLPQYLTMPPDTPSQPAHPAQPAHPTQPTQPIYANRQHLTHHGKAFTSSSLPEDTKIALQNEENVQKIRIGGHDTGTANPARPASKIEDDDSGIAMNSLTKRLHGSSKPIPITEKKSIFTIAYDDTRTRQLRPDSSSTSY